MRQWDSFLNRSIFDESVVFVATDTVYTAFQNSLAVDLPGILEIVRLKF